MTAKEPRREIETLQRNLPGSWNEIPEENRLGLLKRLLYSDGYETKIEILYDLLKVPRNYFLAMDEGQILELINCLDFLKIDSITDPIVASFEHRGRKYYLPKAKFQNGTAIEYPIADEFYTKFCKSGADNDLLALCGTLCREAHRNAENAKKRGDIRVPLHSRNEALERAQDLKGLPIEISTSCLLYFSGIKQYINQTYGPWIFHRKDNFEAGEVDFENSDDEENSFGWWGAFFDVAESGVFGNLKSVFQTSFHSICIYLVKKRKEKLEFDKKLNKSQNQNNLE